MLILKFTKTKICSLTVLSRTLSHFLPKFEVIYDRAKTFQDCIAIVDHMGHYKYKDLYYQADNFSKRLREFDQNIVVNKQTKIAFLCPSDFTYVVAQWACWMCGFVAVPLCQKHPPNQLEYYIRDAQCEAVVTTEEFGKILKPIAQKLKMPLIKIEHSNNIENLATANKLPISISEQFSKLPAMFVYTSGTTGPPKGVILSHENLHVQASAVNQAWEIKSNDVIIHALPLHHLHGILNGVISPVLAGASVVLLPKFDAKEIWKWFLGERSVQPTIFHAVPTMYSFLIVEMNKYLASCKDPYQLDYIRNHCKLNIRFMACGSASLPTPIRVEWERLTGHSLIERYGMTELGMVFTNPLHAERKPGSVGQPFPGIRAKIDKPSHGPNKRDAIVQGGGQETDLKFEGEIGELLIKGQNVFQGYWNREQSTKESFTKDGWFKTGDTVEYLNGSYRILGRSSVDIIKSGGYKISALDVECQLLANPKIKECCVVGLPDTTWGEKVAAIIVPVEAPLYLEEVREWCMDKLPNYSIPSVLITLNELPRNLLGKVNKTELRLKVFPDIK